MGRSAEAHLLLKGGTGEGKALQRFLLLKEMELGGGTEVMVGLVQAGAAVMVTVSESTALHPVGTGPGDRRISKEGERKFTLGINWAVKRPCGIWPLLEDRSGRGAMHYLALGRQLLLGPASQECGLEERFHRREENLIHSQTPTVKAL